MKVFITGGAGYVGYSLVHKLLHDKDIELITIYDNLSRKNYALFTSDKVNGDKIRFIQGELLDSRKLKKSIQGHDLVMHLAAKVTTPYADYDAHNFEQVNHWGTSELAMAIETTESVQRVIYLSSLSVYGSHEEPITLSSETNPHSFYGISKLRGEEQLRRLKDKKEITIIRSGNVYGFNPALRLDAVINRFLFEANFTGRISIQGSGEQHRAFIHVLKLAEILAQLAGQKVQPGIYNLAEYNMSINDIVKVLRGVFPELEFIHVNQNIRMRDVILDLEKIELLKLLESKKSFEEEIKDFVQSFSF